MFYRQETKVQKPEDPKKPMTSPNHRELEMSA
jgi:hypothetical protein